jgi:hypothetical protein
VVARAAAVKYAVASRNSTASARESVRASLPPPVRGGEGVRGGMSVE